MPDSFKASTVALRKESVDRNVAVRAQTVLFKVALRKESVDRNDDLHGPGSYARASLSARRAWIEMFSESKCVYGILRRSPQGERG